MPAVNSLPGEGYAGDPINERVRLINVMLAELKAAFGRGTATVLNTATTVVVTHGLGWTPVAGDIIVCPAEDVGLVTSFWVDTYTATEFTINVDQDPGADVDFAWMAQQLD